MLACTETCTIFHRQYNPGTRLDDWQSQVLHGVSWYAKQGAIVSKDGLDSADTITIRIPVSVAPNGIIAVPGDLIVFGQINLADWQWDPFQFDSGVILQSRDFRPKLLEGLERYTVTATRDNRRGPGVLHHYRIEGKA